MNTQQNIIHKDFNTLFNKKERITLLGKNYINLWTLVIILFVTFIAIGFANGSLSYLGKKMTDPYVNWLNIRLDGASSENSKLIIDNCNVDSIRTNYDIISTEGYNIFWLDISDFENKEMVRTEKGRTIELNDTLLSRIIAECKYGDGFESEYDFGLIVTKELLSKYNYPKNTKFIYHNFSYKGFNGDTLRNIAIPILGVTDFLPGKTQFISLPFFYYNRMKSASLVRNPFIPDDEKSLLLFVDAKEDKASKLSNKILEFLLADSYYGKFSPYNDVIENMSFENYYNIKITFEPAPDNIYFIDFLYNYLLENDVISIGKNIIRLYGVEGRMSTKLSSEHHAIAINFKELGKIRSFAEFMAKENGIEIDIAQVEAKENYSFITRLTKIISLILIGFSILSICLFLSNLLRNHLENIRMNIGTFKAFGLDSLTLQKIYLKVIYSVVLSAMGIAIIAGWLFGKIGGMRLFLKMFGSENLEKGEDYFQLFDFWTLLSIVLILLISFIVLNFTARRILRKSPGDLIYNR